MTACSFIFLSAAFCGCIATAQQIGCQATTSSVVGSYAFIGTEVPLGGLVMTPPGTNTSTGTTSSQTYSNTTIGMLLSNLNGTTAFSTAGVLYFDGAGNVSVATGTSPLGAKSNVGTYVVNTDCTINVTLTDTLNTTPGTNGALPKEGTTMLIGLVLGGGTEIDLSEPQSTTSTNGNTPLVPGEFASRVAVELIRTYPYGCSTANLVGAYGIVGSGYALVAATTTTTSTGTTATTTSNTVQPVSFLARLRFDGNGKIVPDTITSTSPLGAFQYIGTYTVNFDCSGTMTLTPMTTATTTTTGSSGTSGTSGTTTTTTTTTSSTPITVSFVLTPPALYSTGGSTAGSSSPAFEFTLTNSNETLSGYGRAQ